MLYCKCYCKMLYFKFLSSRLFSSRQHGFSTFRTSSHTTILLSIVDPLKEKNCSGAFLFMVIFASHFSCFLFIFNRLLASCAMSVLQTATYPRRSMKRQLLRSVSIYALLVTYFSSFLFIFHQISGHSCHIWAPNSNTSAQIIFIYFLSRKVSKA